MSIIIIVSQFIYADNIVVQTALTAGIDMLWHFLALKNSVTDW